MCVRRVEVRMRMKETKVGEAWARADGEVDGGGAGGSLWLRRTSTYPRLRCVGVDADGSGSRETGMHPLGLTPSGSESSPTVSSSVSLSVSRSRSPTLSHPWILQAHTRAFEGDSGSPPLPARMYADARIHGTLTRPSSAARALCDACLPTWRKYVENGKGRGACRCSGRWGRRRRQRRGAGETGRNGKQRTRSGRKQGRSTVRVLDDGRTGKEGSGERGRVMWFGLVRVVVLVGGKRVCKRRNPVWAKRDEGSCAGGMDADCATTREDDDEANPALQDINIDIQ
ncbi:hypothetical protein B0H16DRAFT_334605 [Mycena metata]|uniref:Uncharacterized protein n=1 Tax=Mycena metata TaxID=1033252 RepID=A0AAD7JQX4_9AGAR|nr:hypothetical protein B0H16DRAFT_334605 [Mycena metata]